jgi:methylated-DNA-[protein]-cysteine S-methyltransferase
MLEWTEVHIDRGLRLRLTASPDGLRMIEFRPEERAPEGRRNDRNSTVLETARQLRAYFDGELKDFRLTLDMVGTPFQKSVWRELERIPYGRTRSYRELACVIGAPKAVRAVGAANGANPIPIVVPCHRVIGSSGKLVGFGGGLELKRRLLELEGAQLRCFEYSGEL